MYILGICILYMYIIVYMYIGANIINSPHKEVICFFDLKSFGSFTIQIHFVYLFQLHTTLINYL